ncbi:MAG: GrpB family protein [Lyngbya sp.]|nr:GrpB family protein [Lyngbya sp.]
MKKVEVVPPNPNWEIDFQKESQQIANIFGENAIAIHHIGSTSIPGIYAKPVIDLLVEVKEITKVDEKNAEMESFGYTIMGEFGIVGRRYFRKDNSVGIRTHHVHVFEVGSTEVKRHLAFRDYLIAHPEDAQKYSVLKQELAAKYPHDIEAYMDGKDSFIKEMEKKAVEWFGERG